MTTPTREESAQLPCYRSGAAARLARMPVTTLRIWERRYGVVSPPKTPSGQRLYSADDVRRLVLLKKLVERGHAIGSIAKLDLEQLDRLALTYADASFPHVAPESPSDATLVVVGPTLARRLLADLPALQSADRQGLTVFDDLGEALAKAGSLKADALLIHLSSLQDETVDSVLSLSNSCHAKVVAVIYAFGTDRAVNALRHAGVRVHREPLGQPVASQMLHDLAFAARQHADAQTPSPTPRSPRRYSDDALATMADMSATISCECPRHITELVLQLSAFEQYSDECVSRTPADAALHRYLGEVANRARAMFELALERIAREEKWTI